MEQYFESKNKELEEKYPDIKVIKKLEDMKVACFTYFGKEPENHAFEKMKEWALKNNVRFNDEAYRIFGYNHPDPSDVDDANEIYGYEVCVTISDSLYEQLEDVPADFVKGTYDNVKRKIIAGGKYAVTSVKRDETGDIGTNIMAAWKRFTSWMDESKYLWGGMQYLEEHLGFSESDNHIGGVDLYISVKDTPAEILSEKVQEVLPSFRAAIFKTEGSDSEKIAFACWDKAITFAKENKLNGDACRIFEYNKGFDHRPPFFHVIMIWLPKDFDETSCIKSSDVTFDTFGGGTYMTVDSSLEKLMETWMLMEKWRKDTKTKFGKHQWVEEWILKDFTFPYEKIRVFYPISAK